MNDDHLYAIPAAYLGDTDLEAISQRYPTEAKEIARLDELMRYGEETPEEFCDLCQLLYDVGETDNAEYLLRRNLDEDDPSHDLYFKLFGNEKLEEFEFAIKSFESQFELPLSFLEQNDFLDSAFRTEGGPERSDLFALLSSQCEIRFGYSRKDKIDCTVNILDSSRTIFGADECLSLFFVSGVWEIAE